MLLRISLGLLLAALWVPSIAFGRVWTDDTNTYTQEAELVDFDSHTVVLRKAEGTLVAIPLERLSEADREFLKTDAAQKIVADEEAGSSREWVLNNGAKIEGRIVQYGTREIVLDRRTGRLTVNGHFFSELNPHQQTLIPLIASHFEKREFTTERQLEQFIASRRGPATYSVDGVLVELEDGQQIAVPMFLFTSRDRQVLEPGWKAWQATDKDDRRRNEQNLMLESLASSYQRNRQIDHQIQMVNMARDWFDLWEVQVFAPNGAFTWEVVPARNSLAAQEIALQRHPGMRVGITRMISRRGNR